MTNTAFAIAPIAKPLLAESVYEQLLVSLVRGDLAPGERLNVDQLAAACGVSRTPVREALARLAHARLVDISRNSSTTVSEWGVTDMQTRARMVGGIARGIVLDPVTDLDSIGTALGDEVTGAFVRACTAIADAAASDLAAEGLRELAAPLALFLEEGAAARHGVRVDRTRFAPAFDYLCEALASGDRSEVAAAIDDSTAVLVEAMVVLPA